jgi:hypothetical protein
MGGSSSVYFSRVDRMTFPFDSGTGSAVGNMTQSKVYIGGCNSSQYGYCLGGYLGSPVTSLVDRITFPFDSGTGSVVGNISRSLAYTVGVDGTDFVTLFV